MERSVRGRGVEKEERGEGSVWREADVLCQNKRPFFISCCKLIKI